MRRGVLSGRDNMRASSMIKILILLAFFLTGSVGSAAPYYDSCSQSSSRVQSSASRLRRAELNIERVTDNFYRTQDQVESRLGTLQALADQAYAYYQSAGSVSSGYTAGCVVSIFFRGGYGCVGSSIRYGIMARARAAAAYRTAVSRRDSYAVYADGYIRRQAERVNTERARYNDAATAYNAAVTDFNQCRAAYPCPPEYAHRCSTID